MTNEEKAQNILSKINYAERILIIASQPADHDCFSSALTMKWFIEQLGKDNVRIYGFFPIPDKFKNFPNIDEVQSKFPDGVDFNMYDLIIMVDGGEFSRYFTNKPDPYITNLDPEKLVNIDHHEIGDIENLIPERNLSKQDSCTCKVIYDYFLKPSKLQIPQHVATWMYKALLWDTSNFKWAIHSDTFDFANTLINLGVNHYECANMEIPKAEIDFMVWAIQHTQYYPESRTALLTLDHNLLAEVEGLFGKDWDNQDRDRYYKNVFSKIVEGYDYYMVIKPKDDSMVSITWRSRDFGSKIDLRPFLRDLGFGGGGHPSAGGAKSKLSVNETRDMIVRNLAEKLKAN